VREVFKANEKLKDYARELLDVQKTVLAEKFRESLRKKGETLEHIIDLYNSYLEPEEVKEFEGEIIDPLYRLISLTPTACQIVGLPIMNRLRFIKQLSFSYITYPTANHTRFEHSIGVYHLARKLSEVEAVKKLLNEELEEAFSIAALIHDLGQGPGCHSLEKLFGGKYDEMKTIEILKEEKFGFKKILDSNLLNLIEKILPGGKPPNPNKENEAIFTFLREALDSEIDIDRLDFLNRDRYFCGIQTGGVDSLLLLKHVKPGLYEKGWRYSFSDDSQAIELINAAISARRELYPLVYQEEKRMAVDEAYCHALFVFSNEISPKDWKLVANKIIYLTDYQVMSLLMMSTDNYIHEFVNSAITCNVPYVQCYRLRFINEEGKINKIAVDFWEMLKTYKMEQVVLLEIALCDLIGIETSGFHPRLFIRYPWKGRDPNMEIESTVLINTKDGKIEDIGKLSQAARQLLTIILPTYLNIFFFVDRKYKEKAEKILRKIFEVPEMAKNFLTEVEEQIINPKGRFPTLEEAKFSDSFKNSLKAP
jgi:HD superfamily phosphohydrolase